MPRTKEGGFIIDDSTVVLKDNPYKKPSKKRNVERQSSLF